MGKTIRKVIGKIHLWLGFIAGLVLFLSLLPASVFVFEKELTNLCYKDLVYVPAVKTTSLPLSDIRKIAQTGLGKDKPINEVLILRDASKSYVCSAYSNNKHPGLSFFSQYLYWDQLYVDQYTGKILGEIDMRYNWINLLRYAHQQLLLNYDVGHWFVAIASLIIFVSIITGLVLWFPRNKAMLKQRFTIKRNTRWRRKNYDIHNVGGFYTHLVILLLATTGLVWSFNWWQNGIYRILGDDPKTVFQHKTFINNTNKHHTSYPLDKIYNNAITKQKNWTLLYIAMPGSGEEPNADQYSVYLNFNNHGGWDEADEYNYDKHSGLLVTQSRQQDKTIGEKWRNSNYAIHTGSLYGLPTKILASLATLICAFLPITGFFIWYGRRKKNKPVKMIKRRQQYLRNI